MATSDSELKTEVRNFTGLTSEILPDPNFDTAFKRAQRHIRTRKNISDDSFDFYASVAREDALFWWACLFAKTANGDLDSGDMQVGAIDIEGILSKDNGTVTSWLRNAQTAIRSIDSNGDYPFGVGITSPTRENREYGGDDDTGIQL